MAKYLKVETLSNKVKLVLIYQAIKIDLKKGQETVKKCISTVQENVERKIYKWLLRDQGGKKMHVKM